jgi:subtilase family serine protease
MRLDRIRRRRVLAVTAATLATTAATVAIATTGAAHRQAAVRVIPAITDHVLAANLSFPPDTAYCQSHLGISCYSPIQYQRAYDLAPLYQRGVTGKGRTIAIIDSFGSPTIANDLHVFDQNYGLSDPSLEIIQPAGAVPPFDNTNPDHLGWATETTLDVEYAHAIAPDAKILLVETPVAETEGVTGFPEIVQAENYVIDHRLADVITQSFGATENTFPGFDQHNFSSLLNLRFAFKDALAHRVTVLASSGDDGATDAESDGSTLFPMPVNSWPSSDPLVTSVGGSMLNLDNTGSRLSPDVVWNDRFGAGGGGKSAVFAAPLFQLGVRGVVGRQRGTPDISMSAAVNGAAWIYFTFPNPDGSGWNLVGGTSEASPIFSGIVALADQVAGHRLGLINPGLYGLGAVSQHGGSRTGLVDITSGNNSFGGVTGFTAGRGYDLASGWGTIDAAKFVPALALVG